MTIQCILKNSFMFRSLFLGFIILSTCNRIVAQEWYKKPLATNNCIADTTKSVKDLENLLIFYKRLNESEPHIWIGYYYSAYIIFKKSIIATDTSKQLSLLKKAQSYAVQSMRISRNDNEAVLLAGLIDLRINELLKIKHSESSIFYSNKIKKIPKNLRVEYFILNEFKASICKEEEKGMLESLIDQVLSLYSPIAIDQCKESPSWGYYELELLKKEVNKKK